MLHRPATVVSAGKNDFLGEGTMCTTDANMLMLVLLFTRVPGVDHQIDCKGTPWNVAQAWHSGLCWEKFPVRLRHYVYSGHNYADVGTAFPECLKWIPGAIT